MNTHKKMINRTAVALVALWAGLLCTQAIACPPPDCPDCTSGTWPNCPPDCSAGQDCCNVENCETCIGTACLICGGDSNQVCCAGSCCDTSINCQTCANGDCVPCDGDPDLLCCDHITCYDPNDLKCCGYGDGTTCDSQTSQVGFNVGLDSVVSGIESAINSIPRVTAEGWSASASFTATKGELCCEDPQGCSEYYDVSGSVDISGSVGVSIPGLSWTWTSEWPGVGGINASLGITVVPQIDVSGSVSASGRYSDCGGCLTLGASGSATGTLTVTAGGIVTLYSNTGWEWFDNKVNLNVNVSAQAVAVMGAGASGAYKSGSNCEYTGFCLTGYNVTDVTAQGTITFQVLSKDYTVTSDPEVLIYGVSGPEEPQC